MAIEPASPSILVHLANRHLVAALGLESEIKVPDGDGITRDGRAMAMVERSSAIVASFTYFGR
jgi:hypothetical protein